jgi:putative ABC transport system permease protein
VSPLDRKLLRDLWRMKGQAVAIGLVIAVGTMLLIMMDGLVNMLDETRQAYYQRYRLADVFAPVARAPERLVDDLAHLPGVAAAEGRVVGDALIDVEGADLPVRARAVSLPATGAPRLNDIYLSQGRLLNSEQPDEVLLLESFARAHGLVPGDTISATMNGARRTFMIVGLAQSPEFLYTTAPGELLPDDARFAVLWLNRAAMAAAYDMKGAFNEALLSIGRGADEKAVLKAVDRLLEAYGGLGAYSLADQFSNRFVSTEIKELGNTSRSVPPLFLGVAAFLLFIVITRMVQAEREQIGLLKAFGYSGAEVSLHYFKFVLVIAIGGAILGSLAGIVAGHAFAVFYQNFFKFPFLVFRLDPGAFVIGFFVSITSASAGGLLVLRQVFSLTPAVAMRPPAPPDYSRTVQFGRVMRRLLDQPSRMVLRRIMRQPVRMIGAVIGIAAGMALSVATSALMVAFTQMLDVTFTVIDRSDAAVAFVAPMSDRTVHELRRMEGVIAAEPFRIVPVVLRNGLKSYRGSINGFVEEPLLNRALDTDARPIFMRKDGIILSEPLADILEVSAGEVISVEVREGRRPVLQIPVAGIAQSLLGSPTYMEIGALNRALREPGRISGAFLRVDAAYRKEVYRKLKDMPAVVGISEKEVARDSLVRQVNTGAGATRYVMAAIAAIITFGIIYNSARIAFAERARDLASLRVIGFSKGEAAYILLGELALVTLVALPIGAGLGYYLSFALSAAYSTDLYQVPAVFAPQSYGSAMVAVISAAVVSGLLVKRELDRMELVSALKTRE